MKREKIHAVMFWDNDPESFYSVQSLHKTKAGADKALQFDKREKQDTIDEDGSWKVEEMDLFE